MERGTLRHRVRTTTEQALRTGALRQLPTSIHYVEEGGVRYFVRVLEALKRKDEARKEQQDAPGSKFDPFLPPEPGLTVGDVTETHVAVLNKFKVLENHLLIVTRAFEEQEMLLTIEDFEALWRCLSEYDSLGFYNGGREAGASQEHKHLQLVPLPFSPDGPPVPLEPLIRRATAEPGLSRVSGFPFLHRCAGLRAGADADDAYRLYFAMLQAVGMAPEPARPARQSRPYCLLVTRTWMLLVPRRQEHYDGISLNSLAFAGSFFVRDRKELERLKTGGVMNALKAVAIEERT